MNLETDSPARKKSLLGALENLEIKANNLVELANLSDQMVRKFNDPRPIGENLDEMVNKVTKEEIPLYDLIDLFNNVATVIDGATNRIGNNTEEIISLID